MAKKPKSLESQIAKLKQRLAEMPDHADGECTYDHLPCSHCAKRRSIQGTIVALQKQAGISKPVLDDAGQASAPCTTCRRPGRGTGFCSNAYHLQFI